MSEHNDFGKRAELIAKTYLQKSGHEILDENWTFNKAEIDLISLEGSIIVFTEVKARHSDDFGDPATFVDQKKIRNITRAAEAYIEAVDHSGEIRFDVISILFKNKFEYQLKQIKDAFWTYE